MENNIKLINLVTEPISARELFEFIYKKPFVNEFLQHPLKYNIKTIKARVLNGKNGYIQNRETLLNEIKRYVLNFEAC